MKYANIFPVVTDQSKCVIQTPGESTLSCITSLLPMAETYKITQ